MMAAALRLRSALLLLTLATTHLLPVHSFHSPVSSSMSRQTSKLSAAPKAVKVYDGVYSPDSCLELHELSLEHADRSESSIVDRHADEQKTPLEYALDYLMLELEDDSQYVEYWSRDEYINMDAHADIDERYLENEGSIRCPDNSHVLYLKIEETSPTCILDQTGAWIASGGESVELVTVPAVSGRLLRFPGNRMHAVPKPCNRWLLSDEEEAKLEDLLLDEDDEAGIHRSVLLFNSWSKEPPLDVTRDDILGTTIPSGIEIDGMEESPPPQPQEFDKLLLQCNTRDSWADNAIQETSDAEMDSCVRINLMGKRHRRLHPNRSVWLEACGEALAASLQQESVVSKLELEEV